MTTPPQQNPYGPPVTADRNPYAAPVPPPGMPPAAPGMPPQGTAPGYGFPPPPAGPGFPPPAQAAPAHGYGFPPPAPGYGQGPVCRFCGSVPAVEATIRGHQGMILIMRFLKLKGPFCRRCGIAAHRDMTSKSLWQGWWGIASMIINPITMLINLPQRAKINKLPEPIPGAPGTPMPPGKPIFLRPTALLLLVPVAAIGIIITAASQDPAYAEVGDCVHNDGTMADPDLVVTDCNGTKAQYRIVGKLDGSSDYGQCARFASQGAEIGYSQEQGSERFVLCLAPTR